MAPPGLGPASSRTCQNAPASSGPGPDRRCRTTRRSRAGGGPPRAREPRGRRPLRAGGQRPAGSLTARKPAWLLAWLELWYLLVPQHLACQLLQLLPAERLHCELVSGELELECCCRQWRHCVQDRHGCALALHAAELEIVDGLEQRCGHALSA